ncbi:hypothetical protein DCAR_0727387 [Daucus carota subsp. sativus]|uniref:Uncharacterized protein n=1 Tax=Daucus carota subsp. sativus TaxID=79200 RepID=A0AAF0XJ36_DAUCS|nr:hypothetical protein DCAR_0727387 [Daucus carota subsp. sativus]
MLWKRVRYFVYDLRHAVRNCIWLALILIFWRFVLVDHGKALSYVTKAWVCFMVGTLIWFVKTLFVKVLASSFHVSSFLDRIQDALFDQYVIESLSGSPLVEHHLPKASRRGSDHGGGSSLAECWRYCTSGVLVF